MCVPQTHPATARREKKKLLLQKKNCLEKNFHSFPDNKHIAIFAYFLLIFHAQYEPHFSSKAGILTRSKVPLRGSRIVSFIFFLNKFNLETDDRRVNGRGAAAILYLRWESRVLKGRKEGPVSTNEDRQSSLRPLLLWAPSELPQYTHMSAFTEMSKTANGWDIIWDTTKKSKKKSINTYYYYLHFLHLQGKLINR